MHGCTGRDGDDLYGESNSLKTGGVSRLSAWALVDLTAPEPTGN